MADLISESTSQIVGICGVVSYLLAYALLQSGVIGGNGYIYALMNAAAACMVMVSLIHAFNLSALLIQVSFVLLSIGGMIRVALLTRWARFTEDERRFYDDQFPDLEPHFARKLLNAGTWTFIKEGTVIACEGEYLDTLTYISNGKVRIQVQGNEIGYRGAQTFIGELSFLDAAPATATVSVTDPVYAFVISNSVLRQLITRYPEIQLAMTCSFSANTRDTLRKRTEEFIMHQRLT